MPRAAPLVLLALTALACAGREGPPPATPVPVSGRFHQVAVAFADGASLEPDAAARTAALVRQSALDWLEHEGRLAADGALALEVTLDAIHLRGALATWLFASLARPDRLAATAVVVPRDGAIAARTAVRVESRLAGWGWRDRDARLERLARRLGRRIAEGL